MTALLDRVLPSASVIIPIYNDEADLPDLLNCLQQQTYPIDRAEYLLVDNGSRDRTPQMLAAAQSAALLPLHYLSESQIQSSYAARNCGIKAAKGSILAFTDADCRPHPDWLTQLMQPFADRDVAIVAGEVLPLPGKSVFEQYADRYETLSQKHTLAHSFCPYGQTANLAMRRQALEQVGLFRPCLTTGGDADLCWRILRQTAPQAFWKIQFDMDAIVQHRHRSTLGELRRQWQRYGRSNRYLHQLHGVSLARDLTAADYFYRLSRWLLKEIPQAIGNRSLNRSLVLDTPLDLLCGQARSQGQRCAMPEAAMTIDRFSLGCSETGSEVTPDFSEIMPELINLTE